MYIWCDNDMGIIISAGSDAVQYIVNHASVQVIFCVPQTLNIVSSDPIFALFICSDIKGMLKLIE